MMIRLLKLASKVLLIIHSAYITTSATEDRKVARIAAGTGRAHSRLASTAFLEHLNTLLNLLAHVVVAAVAPSWPHR